LVARAGGELFVYLACSSGAPKARCLCASVPTVAAGGFVPTHNSPREQPHSPCREQAAGGWDLGAWHCSTAAEGQSAGFPVNPA